MKDQSLWRGHDRPRFPSTPLPNEVDVVIVGGGISGLTAAYLLKRAGKRVLVLEKDRIGTGETGNTSAHLTYVTDARISELSKTFGREAARRVWEGGAAAIDLIESITSQPSVACGFRRVPGFLCSPFLTDSDQSRALRDDATLAAEMGFSARYVEAGPITGKPAISFADQAIIHPLDYLSGLALAVDGNGSFVREECEVGHVIQDPLAVIVNGENIACTDVFIATNVPLMGAASLLGATLLQTKIYPYSSYVMGGRIDSSLAPGLYSDTNDPYNYLRVHEDQIGPYAIFGGEDHKTGQASDTKARFDRLEAEFKRVVPSVRIERRWSGQVVETDDGLPFIGQTADHQYAATGYAGNGLTFGTLAGMMVHDAILGRPNPLRELFDPNRKAKSAGSIVAYITENVDFPLYFVADRLRPSPNDGIESITRGDGKVLKIDGQRVAVHKTNSGKVLKVSAVCTHMGCIVRWNGAEKTWDCPCHGSRFTPEGQVLGGPAEAPLEPVE